MDFKVTISKQSYFELSDQTHFFNFWTLAFNVLTLNTYFEKTNQTAS